MWRRRVQRRRHCFCPLVKGPEAIGPAAATDEDAPRSCGASLCSQSARPGGTNAQPQTFPRATGSGQRSPWPFWGQVGTHLATHMKHPRHAYRPSGVEVGCPCEHGGRQAPPLSRCGIPRVSTHPNLHNPPTGPHTPRARQPGPPDNQTEQVMAGKNPHGPANLRPPPVSIPSLRMRRRDGRRTSSWYLDWLRCL